MSMPLMVFAAGKGTRMGSLTASMPKPMIPVAGKPLIDHALRLGTQAGAAPIVVNLHYKSQMLRDHLAGQPVQFSDENSALLETGGGLRKAMPLLGASPVMTLNSDAVWQGPNPLSTLINAWHPAYEALLLLVKPQDAHGHKGQGDFQIADDGRLTRAAGLVYTGAQIIRTDVLTEISETAFSLNVAWDKIAQRGRLYGVVYDGTWCDVGQPESIPLAESMLDV